MKVQAVDEAIQAVKVARKYALEPLREALAREGRKQAWLREQLRERVGITVKPAAFSNYLNGYARIPRNVLSMVCWIAGAQERDILARVADEAVLIQQPRKRKPDKK